MHFDTLLKGGYLVNGEGELSLPQKMDVGIKDDRIAALGELGVSSAEKVLDARGLCIAPGFIDAHSHSEFTLLADGRAEGKICQGITTEINGNCGLSAAPLEGPAREQRTAELEELNIREQWKSFAEYFALLRMRGIALNFMTLVGHGNLRASVVGYEDRPLSERDRKQVFLLLKTSLDDGARGISTGLVYPPGIFAQTGEIIEVAQAARRMGGVVYATHMRSEGDKLLESVEEAIRVGIEASIPVHLSHLKTSEERNWKKIGKVMEMIQRARGRGLRLSCDRYPYTAAGTSLDSLLPVWTFEGGQQEELKKIRNMQGEIERHILKDRPDESSWSRVVITKVRTERNRWMEGKDLIEIGVRLKRTPIQSLFHILLEEELNVDALFFSMSEENLETILREPCTAIGTDSAARSFQGITARGKPHPRGFGSFPRVLGRYARDRGLISLGEAVYRMTGLPAKIFRIRDRGILKEGYFADIAVFDPDTIADRARYENPYQRPKGVHHVFVNGVPVMIQGETTGRLPGRILN